MKLTRIFCFIFNIFFYVKQLRMNFTQPFKFFVTDVASQEAYNLLQREVLVKLLGLNFESFQPKSLFRCILFGSDLFLCPI